MKKTMGNVIAENRKARGMTQLELAEQLGVTDKAVSKWERDLSCPDISSLPQLSRILGVSVEELMQIEKEGEQPEKRSAVQIIDTVLKAVGLAMGIAVTALSMLGELESQSAVSMLGIGLACLGASALSANREINK